MLLFGIFHVVVMLLSFICHLLTKFWPIIPAEATTRKRTKKNNKTTEIWQQKNTKKWEKVGKIQGKTRKLYNGHMSLKVNIDSKIW